MKILLNHCEGNCGNFATPWGDIESTFKNQQLLYTQKQTQGERDHEHTSVHDRLKEYEYLGINLPKEVKDLYKENFQPLR